MRYILWLLILEVAIVPTNGFPGDSIALNKLTPEESRVIVDKGTEKPFSGQYYKCNQEGIYICKQCNAPLYKSKDKFDAGCGWPSFDNEIPGAVRRIPDKDGTRTEIVCSRCSAHLGHVFTGEKLTPKDVRHCVNSISMKFLLAGAVESETAYFASGCFWGSEYVLEKAPGIISTRVGYAGGSAKKPTYKEVCSGKTGHAETVELVFDPKKTTYETLAKLFFETHDPTQLNRQGPDVGEQYRSVIFYTSDAQRQTAATLIDTLRKKGIQVATTLEPAGAFWPAEEYHQKYYDKKGGQPYCHFPRKLF